MRQDRFRDYSVSAIERLGNRLEGKGRTLLYGLAAAVALAALVGMWSWWNEGRTDAARRALGQAIEIAEAPLASTTQPPPPASTTPSFPNERERAQKAVEAFQKVVAQHPAPYSEVARFFSAVNQLTLDRNSGFSELEALTKSGNTDVAARSRFALAQAREEDGQLDQAAALYKDLLSNKNPTIPPDTVNFRLAALYEKQGKKKDATDLLFGIVEAARKARDGEGKPLLQSATAREAAQKLETLDPARFAQLPPEPATGGFPS